MERHEVAKVIEDCAAKVGAWSTAQYRHEQALLLQEVLPKISEYLRKRATAVRAGTANGVYD